MSNKEAIITYLNTAQFPMDEDKHKKHSLDGVNVLMSVKYGGLPWFLGLFFI